MRKRNNGKWYKHGTWWRKLFLNRRYKDVLFRRLFRDKQDLLNLYNALNDSTYQNPSELEVVTMEDVIFMKMKNDLSFIIGSHLNLYEHQSTWNPNMPLRGLLYFAQQFEGLLGAREDDIYGKNRIELPTPEYIVFYHGNDMRSDSQILYLSDSFPEGQGSGCLECRCKVLNINRGCNQQLMERCHRLWEYSELISEVEENIQKGMQREEAVQTAIDECIKKGILADILLVEKAEVLHMLLTEYDEKKHLKNTFREGWEEGREEGLAEGLKAGQVKGREDHLKELIEKKLSKGKTIPKIAEELEEDIVVIEKFAPECRESHGDPLAKK